MNMFLHELRSYRKTTAVWTASLVAVSVLFIAMYAAIRPDLNEFKTYIENMPVGMRMAFGISPKYITTLEGFYSFSFVFVVLFGAIQAMHLGTSIISKEVRDKTADFLLTKPVTRKSIITAKLLAALSCIIITNAVYLPVTTIAASTVKVNSSSMTKFFMISITMLFVQIIFLSIGFMISAAAPKIRSVISVSLSIVFGFYIIGMLGAVIGEEAVRYLSPLKYFDVMYIIKNTSYEASFAALGGIIAIISIIAGYNLYLKKDIHAV